MAREDDFPRLLEALLRDGAAGARQAAGAQAGARASEGGDPQELLPLLRALALEPGEPAPEDCARLEAALARVDAWVARSLKGEARREAEAILAVERERLARLREGW